MRLVFTKLFECRQSTNTFCRSDILTMTAYVSLDVEPLELKVILLEKEFRTQENTALIKA